jgi:nucleoside-diphosphate-sugar epimerase
VIVALTGGTGFVGGHVLGRLLDAGHSVRAMARRPQTRQTDGLEWIYAALDTPGAFDRLLDGVDVVIHAAGAVNSPTRAGFKYVNVDGTRSILDAAIARAVARFVHVSSLSAREPQLSNYGWSKAEAETIVVTSTTDWRIVRPPAIYGPGDTDNLELFKFAQRGIVPLPAAGRMSLIHADDLARLIVAMAENPDSHMMFEADDGTPGGWSHIDYARAIGVAVGRKPMTLRLPRAALALAAALDGLVRGDRAKLTADRVSYMTHPDWVIDPAKRPPADFWQPHIATAQGLKDTALWYRAQGWL